LNRQPVRGLAAARMMAMLTYRSKSVFDKRFGRRLQNEAMFEVESYLRYQGQKLVERFDANSYVALTKAMDAHDIGRNRGDYISVLNSIQQPSLIISADSDILYLPEEQKELATHIPNAMLETMQTDNGHDAFLIDVKEVNEIVVSFKKNPARAFKQ
jgi:homoserine O-acetyltransferase